MDSVKRLLPLQLDSFKKEVAKARIIISNPDSTSAELSTSANTLKTKWDPLENLFEKLMQLLHSSDPEGSDATVTNDFTNAYKEKEAQLDAYVELTTKLEIKLKRRPSNDATSKGGTLAGGAAAPPARRTYAKLPLLTLLDYAGDPALFHPYWDSFQANVDSRPDLEPVEKMSYLIGTLKGDAANVVKGLKVTDANYPVAIDLIRKRFDDKQTIVAAHMTKVMNLVEGSKPCQDVTSLGRLFDQVNIQIRALEALKVDTKGMATTLITAFQRKMPQEMHLLWQREPTPLDDWEAMSDFITNEISINSRVKQARPGASEEKKQQELKKTKETPSSAAALFADSKKPSAKATKKSSPSSDAKTTEVHKCMFCKSKDHGKTGKCPMGVKERKEVMKKDNRCFKCARKRDGVDHKCDAKCYHCHKEDHHIYLCEELTKAATVVTIVPTTSLVSLKVLQVTVKGPTGLTRKVGCLLDGGSHRSYVSDAVATALHLKCRGKERMAIHTFGGNVINRTLKRRKLVLTSPTGDEEEVEMLGKDVICDSIDAVDPGKWREALSPQGLPCAYDTITKEEPWTGVIDILIGADLYYKFVTGSSIRLTEELMAVETTFGWVLHGPMDGEAGPEIATLHASAVPQEESPRFLLAKLFDLDRVLEKDGATSAKLDEDRCIEYFHKTLKRKESEPGYEVSLQFKPNHPPLSPGLGSATQSLEKQLNKMRKNPDLLKTYHGILEEYERNGMIEEVPEEEMKNPTGVVYYIPHMAVVKPEAKSTNVRPVFDAKRGNPSLNDCIETGPNLVPPMTEILMRFRSYPIALTADFKQAFLCVGLQEQDRNSARFLWPEDPFSPASRVRHMRWKSAAFGLTSSPFHMSAVMNHHTDQYKHSHPSAVEAMQKGRYVDDVAAGGDTVEECLQLAKDATRIAAEGGFKLRRWTTDNHKLQKMLDDFQGEASTEEVINFKDTMDKVLGTVWVKGSDLLTFNVDQLIKHCHSLRGKSNLRTVLSISARIYDVLGLVSPVVITCRILIQKIWRHKLDWDQPLPDDLNKEFWGWVSELPKLSEVKVPRHYFGREVDPLEIQLILCSDASTKAYGANAYFRSVNREGAITVTFVASRARVAPVDPPTLPRMELMAAELSVMLGVSILQALGPKYAGRIQVFRFLDSLISYYWIHTDPLKLKTFPSNRVRTIIKYSKIEEWRFIAGKENPADLCSRGVSAATLADKDSLWWKGACWMSRPLSEWPSEQPNEAPDDLTGYKDEIKKSKTLSAAAAAERIDEEAESVVDEEVPPADNLKQLIEISRYSSIRTVTRLTAIRIRAFRDCCEDYIAMKKGLPEKVRPKRRVLQPVELHEALCYQIRRLQQEQFPSEIACLTAKKPKDVKRSSRIAKFHPYWDPVDRVIKLRGRTGLSNVLEESPNLPLIPATAPKDTKVFHLVELMIRSAHIRLEHSGVVGTLCELRRTIWIIHGRRIVARVLKECVICNRNQKKPYEVPMASLPADRCSFAFAFEVTGLDFAGPLFDDQGNKCWILLFTCGTTRALHLELTSDMTAQTVIAAIESFFLDFGVSRVIYSDNAKQFKKTNVELAKRWAKIEYDVQTYVADKGVTWKFIVEAAPWWGGFWERMVATVKRLLRKVLGKFKLSFRALQFALKKIRGVINSRPITYEMDDHREPRAICPNDILLGRRPSIMPSPVFPDRVNASQMEIVASLRAVEEAYQQFKSVWSRHYLQERAIHYSWRHREDQVKVGEVVLIQEDNKKRVDWQVGLITQVFPSQSDGIVRRASVKTATSTLQRPVQRLCAFEVQAAGELLPAATAEVDDGVDDDEEDSPSSETGSDLEEEEAQSVADGTVAPSNQEAANQPADAQEEPPAAYNDEDELPGLELAAGAPNARSAPARRGRGRPPKASVAHPPTGDGQGGSVEDGLWVPTGTTRYGRVIKTKRPNSY